MRALVSISRNLNSIDLCSVDLRSWNWKSVGEAMNFMGILQGGLNLIVRCCFGCLSPAWDVEGRPFKGMLD